MAKETGQLFLNNPKKMKSPGNYYSNIAKQELEALDQNRHPLVNENAQGLSDSRKIVVVGKNKILGMESEYEKDADGKDIMSRFVRSRAKLKTVLQYEAASLAINSRGGSGYLVTPGELKKAGIQVKDGEKPFTVPSIAMVRTESEDPKKQYRAETGYEHVYYDINQTPEPEKTLAAVRDQFLQTVKEESRDKVRPKEVDWEKNHVTWFNPYKGNSHADPHEIVADAKAQRLACAQNGVYMKINPADKEDLKKAIRDALTDPKYIYKSGDKETNFNTERIAKIMTVPAKGKKMNLVEIYNMQLRDGLKKAKEQEKDASPAPAVQKEKEMGSF